MGLPKTLQAVAEHFNCSSVEFLPIEVSGGAGSARYHWESNFMGNEYMTAQISQHMLVTIMTLALLEDTGWYKPDYS